MNTWSQLKYAVETHRRGELQAALEACLGLIQGGSSHWQAVWRLVVTASELGCYESATQQALSGVTPDRASLLRSLFAEARGYLDQPVLELCSFKVDNRMNPRVLRELAQKLDADTFVETGTYKGDTTAIAAEIYADVLTIELSPQLCAAAQVRFLEQPHVKVFQGDSGQMLHEILPLVEGRAVLWLDGHYSMGVTAKGAKNTPIMEELEAVKAHLKIDPVVLIDDLRCFVTDLSIQTPSLEGYPSVSEVEQATLPIFENPVFAVAGDVAIAYDAARGVGISPVLNACTISRRFEGTTDVRAVIAAEELLSEAKGEEFDTLRSLPHVYGGDEVVGLCGHYRLWNGLVTAVSGDPREACVELQRAIELGCDHWRVHWYLAQTTHACGYVPQARAALERVLAAAPDFEEARELAAALNGALA